MIGEPTDSKSVELVEKEQVEKIESAPFHIQDRVDILLVKAGVKPAALITELDIPENAQRLEELKELLDGLSLPNNFEKSVFHIENTDGQFEKKIVNILIGKDLQRLEDLEKARDEKSAIAEGLALGYPASAVSTYVDKSPSIMRWELPEDVKGEYYYPFIKFQLSRSNWPIEIETAREWADTVRTNSSMLFDHLSAYTNAKELGIDNKKNGGGTN
jgi:hypothetical protein